MVVMLSPPSAVRLTGFPLLPTVAAKLVGSSSGVAVAVGVAIAGVAVAAGMVVAAGVTVVGVLAGCSIVEVPLVVVQALIRSRKPAQLIAISVCKNAFFIIAIKPLHDHNSVFSVFNSAIDFYPHFSHCRILSKREFIY